MKNLFKSFIALLAAATTFAACQQEVALLGTKIEVNPTDAISFAATDATPVTVDIISDGEWIATSSPWISVTPKYGTGNTTVEIIALDNVDENKVMCKPRTGSVSFAVSGSKVDLVVNQDGDASLLMKTLPFEEKFEDGMGDFSTENVNVPDGKVIWVTSTYSGNSYAYASGYGLGAVESWLVSPSFDLTGETCAVLSFTHCYKYGNTSLLTLWVKEVDGEWTEVTIPAYGNGSYDWTDVSVDLSAFCGKKIKVGFKYVSTADAAANWEIDNFSFQNVAIPSIAVKKDAIDIMATATEATIDVVALNLGKNTWTLSADENYAWVTKIEPASGSESAAVKVTVTENTDTENSRSASFTLKSDGLDDVKVTLTQAKAVAEDDMPKTIAELCEVITGTSSEKSTYTAKLTDAVVTYVNGKNVFLEDASGAILYFNSSATVFTPGQKISGVISGEGYVYNNLKELSSMDVTKATITTGAEIPLTTISIADLVADYSSYISMRVKLEKVKVTDGIGGDDRDGTIAQGDEEMLLRAGLKGLGAIETGAVGDMIGFPSIYGEKKQFTFWDVEHFTVDASVKTFGVSSTSITVDSDATSATISVTGNSAWTAATTSEGASIDPTSGEGAGDITVSFAANEGTESKSYTVTVSTEEDVDTKSFDVTINQKAAVIPPKTLPFSEDFSDGFGDFKIDNVSVPEGKSVWSTGVYGGVNYAKANGNNLGDGVEAWLISPSIDLTKETAAFLSFEHCYKYGTTDEMTLWAKEDGGSWTQATIPAYGEGKYDWTKVIIDLSTYAGKTIQFAFKYTSSSAGAAAWEIAKLSFTNSKPVADNKITATATLDIDMGKTGQIEASNTAGLAMSYASDNEAVATVDATGLVTAVAAGTAKITISTEATADYNAASATCTVTVTDPNGPKVLIIDGSKLTSTYTTAAADYKYGDVTVTMSDGAKSIASAGDKKFTASAILIGKSGKYIFNKTAIPGKITKFEIYANKGASAKVSVGVCFSDKPISQYDASKAWTATLETLDSVYDCSSKLSGKDCYFWYQVTNANNSQIEFRITYTKSEGGEGSGNIGIDDWKQEGNGDVNIDDWTVDEAGNNSGFTEGYKGGASLNDWIVE